MVYQNIWNPKQIFSRGTTSESLHFPNVSKCEVVQWRRIVAPLISNQWLLEDTKLGTAGLEGTGDLDGFSSVPHAGSSFPTPQVIPQTLLKCTGYSWVRKITLTFLDCVSSLCNLFWWKTQLPDKWKKCFRLQPFTSWRKFQKCPEDKKRKKAGISLHLSPGMKEMTSFAIISFSWRVFLAKFGSGRSKYAKNWRLISPT